MNTTRRLLTVPQHGGSVPEMPETAYEESHLKVLRLLESDPGLSQRDLSRALGISLGKTNYCMRALLDKGLIKMQNFRQSKNKLRYAYLLTPVGLAEKSKLTAEYLRRKVVEYEALQAEIEALRAEMDSVQGSRE